jgi:hypothetical protein
VSEIKEPTEERQLEFFNLLIKTGGEVQAACDTMQEPYALGYAYQLVKKYRKYFLDLVEQDIVLDSAKARKVLSDTMLADGSNPAQSLRMQAAVHVLDRAGLTKQERIKVEAENATGLIILPAKKETTNE